MIVHEAQTDEDMAAVKSFVTQPEIWDAICEVPTDPEFYDLPEGFWLMMLSGNDLIGVYYIHWIGAACCQIHAHVNPVWRQSIESLQTGKEALRWIYDHLPQCRKVIARVPTLYENVRAYCELHKMRVEGVNRQSVLRHGELYDEYLIGITRQEIGDYIEA